VAARPAQASAATIIDRPDGYAMLTDTTRCVGCRRCEAACNRVNKLPAPKSSFEDPSVFEETRRTTAEAYTVVNRYENLQWEKPVFRKVQCMHCAEPACASACLVGALKKTEEGSVVWDEKLCMGCRYCMTACPFYVPAFEYFDAGSPAIRKCTMCYQRTAKGIAPACAEACPVEATVFGKRNDLLRIARERIAGQPGKYVDHIYGESEAGGTDWLYLAGVSFEQLGLPGNVGTTPFPELTKDFLSMVPLVLIVWPALLGGFYAWTKTRQQAIRRENTEH
ncbi:MAG: hypothetical protein A2147_05430, partial [Chloroflexi bacterium RBG_16_57_8]